MPDNQLTEETITGTYEGKERLRTDTGTRLLIKDDKFPHSDYTTGVTVFDNQTALVEQVANDLDPGMKVSLKINIKQGPNGKQRNLLEILNRFSNPTPPATQPVTQSTQAPQQSGGYIPTPSDQWRADGQETGNSKTNATALIVAYYERTGELPSWEWMQNYAIAVNRLAAYIRFYNPNVEEEPSVEGDVTEDNPF